MGDFFLVCLFCRVNVLGVVGCCDGLGCGSDLLGVWGGRDLGVSVCGLFVWVFMLV